MTCQYCNQTACATTTSLIDGRVVCTWSEDWRHECEARQIANMRTLAERQAYMFGKFERVQERGQWITKCTQQGIQQKRGADALAKMKRTVATLWRASNKRP